MVKTGAEISEICAALFALYAIIGLVVDPLVKETRMLRQIVEEQLKELNAEAYSFHNVPALRRSPKNRGVGAPGLPICVPLNDF
jgi:hypothetical protein